MANQTERTQIAVLQNDMKQVKYDIHDIKTTQAAGFASLEAKIDAFDDRYAQKSEIRSFKFVTVPLIILVTAVITGLVTFFFTHLNSSSSNSPTTSATTTTTTPTGSTSTTSTKDNTSTPTPETKSNSTTNSSPNGGVNLTLPKAEL